MRYNLQSYSVPNTQKEERKQASTLYYSLRNFPGFQSVQQLLRRIRGKIFIESIPANTTGNLYHGGIHTSSQTLHLRDSEKAVSSCLATLNSELFLDCVQNLVRAPHHARGCTTYLDVVLTDLIPVVHCVESGHLIHTHGSHTRDLSNLVHGADRQPLILVLGKPKKGHDGRLLTSLRVLCNNLLHSLVVLGREIERCVGVIILCVVVHKDGIRASSSGSAKASQLVERSGTLRDSALHHTPND
mmetsp:Transcript_4517/g.9338  ORF Transcript_4517/g.9338 Transcript_4517/m.9338 type:complete len:244 (+) Transcript_4517:559-1290(+)